MVHIVCVLVTVLNKIIVKHSYLMPHDNDLLNAKLFKIDLKSEYHQVHICDEDIPKTTFQTLFGYNNF